jgi:serine/threonine protein kinase, bacterial
MLSPLTPGTLLHGCYALKGILARGEFGFIYMAADQNQANQPCTLEEFMPADGNPALLLPLRDYFQTAIADLTRLNHPQILRARLIIADAQRLFLVQDDIAANTCREMLSERLAQGQTFTEIEVQQWLTASLSALAYLHDRGIYHGNLSLDSILLQEADQLPVLSNFGLIRKLAIDYQFQSLNPAWTAAWSATPPTPPTDLYDLAAVALALLTGQELPPGTDPTQWLEWRQLVSPTFARLLRRMLLPQAQGRFSSAHKALLASQSPPRRDVDSSRLSPNVDSSRLPPNVDSSRLSSNAPSPAATTRKDYSLPILAAIFTVLAGLVTWRIINLVPPQATSNPTVAIASLSPMSEDQMQIDLRDRRRQSGIRYSLFTELVDELFYAKHPDWANRSLTGTTGATMKAEWNQLAATLLTRLESLSHEARRDLGKYNRTTYDSWLTAAHPTLDPKAIAALADTQFLALFPEQQGKTINPRKLGQVWYAIARDTISSQRAKK